jgi:hypothetical protein
MASVLPSTSPLVTLVSSHFINHKQEFLIATIWKDIKEKVSSCFDLSSKCFEAAGNLSDLNTAIYLLYRAAYSLLPAYPQLLECLKCLAAASAIRFSYTGYIRDVHMAVVFGFIALVDFQHITNYSELQSWISEARNL